mmetsp:Transcript_23197/g.57208  ORF Transcript_23197/g.57208 Transcript_23197/m.57208 type:complete len:200 (+) Transcript_23197:73-672(+)
MFAAFSISTATKAAASTFLRRSSSQRPSAFLAASSARSMSGSSSSDRPFEILGIQQVAIGSANKSSLDALWNGIFGFEASATKRLEAENVQEDILKVGTAPFEVEVDLMVPIDENKSPKVHVPPLNHIGLWVDDLPQAVEWMKSQGVRFTPGGIRPGAAGHDITFIHPKGNEEFPICGNGVLIELVQAPPEVIDAMSTK